MWMSKRKWLDTQSQISECQTKYTFLEKDIDKKLWEMAKKILKQPNELLKEIESDEKIDKFVNEFINYSGIH